MVVSVAAETQLLQSSVTGVHSTSGITYGGKSSNNISNQGARTKDAGDVYDVWDDDWQSQ